ncbi:hypothetical protein JVT61DRAFT_3325 [Boletus reticuloceps]|uniref:Myb/SANT-like domain-containing protein n=1 Tax=Boletus reticuloceps TaxID=495285 RepID=A0A8I3AA41_9AGAM|nr:hypothetical protein JVT61DRAFT_3325 [Boletus reticuloceps]
MVKVPRANMDRTIYTTICTWHKKSGVHWDNEKGANIVGPAAWAAHGNFKEFTNQGWKYLPQMEEIWPESSATGAHAVEGGAVLPQADEDNNINKADTNLVVSEFPSINPSNFCSALFLVVNAITSTMAAMNSLASGVTSSTSANCSPLQSSNKCPLSSLSPDETNETLLFSPAALPVSTVSTPAAAITYPRTKHSRTSAMRSITESIGGQKSMMGKNMGNKNTTSITLQQVDSSIHHLSDSINSSLWIC